MDYDFSGKTAIVTGACSGMGLLTCETLSACGANVVMADVNEKALTGKVSEIEKTGGAALGVVCDVRDYKQVENVCEKAMETFGSVDILVNFAGGCATRILGAGGDMLDVPMEVFDWGIDVNLKGPMYFGLAAMKRMAKTGGGVIVNIGSITGEEGADGDISYAAAKAGVMGGLTKSLAMRGARDNVRCCCVSPGPVLTRASMSKMKTLLGRAAEPKEIVDLVLYLASDHAAFITGTNYLIDGGRLICEDRTWN